MKNTMDKEDEIASTEFNELEEDDKGIISFDEIKRQGLENMPSSSWEANLAEQILAESFQKLSLVEHEKIAFDVHGISQNDDIDPDNLDVLLQQVDEYIGDIRRKQAYERAKHINEMYVCDRAFRRMFLRCDRFNSKLAAQRIVKHFEIKRDLFGDGDILGRDVRLSDFSEEDMRALKSGFMQILPSRDAAGRSIFSMAPMYRPDDVSIHSCGRVMWYMMTTTMKDEETQRKGSVGIFSNFGKNARMEPLVLIRKLHEFRSGMPKKLVGIHFCYDDDSLRPFLAGLRLFLPQNISARLKPHFGDLETINFGLQTYGIPTKDHPILSNGSLSLEWHHKWLNVRQVQEASESMKDGVIIPRRFDVLFGRGKSTREHTGNLRAAMLVEMHQAEYEKAEKIQKTMIADRVVAMVHDSLGRFLKWEKSGWVEVEHAAAREKVSHFFRHFRSKKNSTDSGNDSVSTSSIETSTGKRSLTQ